MSPNELVELIKGLYEAGVTATVSIDQYNNVDVEIEPPDLISVESVVPKQRPLFEILDPIIDPSKWDGPNTTLRRVEEVLHPATQTVCLDPDLMNGAADQFPGSGLRDD